MNDVRESQNVTNSNPETNNEIYDLDYLVESAIKLDSKLEDTRKELEGTYKLIGLLYVKNRMRINE